jgi:hypothetical protein
MTSGALGDYPDFARWSDGPRAWGPDGRWRLWFGGKVADAIVELLDDHIATIGRHSAAAIGCVPWLTHPGIADRLAKLHACCIVVDKGARWVPDVLRTAENSFPNVLPGMESYAPPADDGKPVIVGPYSGRIEYEVGPLRTLGMTGHDGKPLLHSKLLVLGRLAWHEYGPHDGPTAEELRFEPLSVWWGSANWTDKAASHLETGTWSDDPQLAREAARYAEDLIGFSEPFGATTPLPVRDLPYVIEDTDAMREAALEMHYYELEMRALEEEDEP